MNSVIETVALLANIAIITGFLVFVSYSKHLHIFLAPINVATSRRPRALGALASTPDMSMEDVGEEDEVVFGAGRIEDFSWKQLLDMATCTECGRCQSQCPAWNTGKPLSPKLLIMDLRDNLFASADRVMAKNRAAGHRGGEPRPLGHRPRRAVVVHHLRGLCRAVPGGHRAHRHHHRHAPLRGADGVEVPHRGRPHAPQRREPGRPLGPRLLQAHRLDRRPGLRGAGHLGHHPRRRRVPLLGGLCRCPRRAGPQGGPGHGPHAPPGRGHLRHPRSQGVVHRRPGPPAGQRVPLPGAGPDEHRDAGERRGEEGHRHLPPLLQLAGQRVPVPGRQLRGHPPQPAARPSGRRRAS